MKNEIQMKLSEEELLKERGEEAGTKAGDEKKKYFALSEQKTVKQRTH